MRKGEERTGGIGWLVPVLLCGALAVISLVMAVGAVVPAIGDAMNVSSRGVGGVLGYLFGTVFFGGIALAGWVSFGKKRRAAADRPAPPLPFDATDLPPGPGLGRRWLLAGPLLLAATVLPPLGALVLMAWIGVTNGYTPAGEPEPTFASEFGDGAEVVWTPAAVSVLVLLVFLVRRKFAPLPKSCLWTAVVAMAPTAGMSVLIDFSAATLPNASLALGAVWLNYWIGRAALWALSRPVAMDLVESDLEIPYFVPLSPARLRVQRDRLLLDRLGSEKSKVHKEIRWSALESVAVVNHAEATSWEASRGTRIDVPAGPVLHIVAEKDEWLIPVPEILGEDLATAISLRANARRSARAALR